MPIKEDKQLTGVVGSDFQPDEEEYFQRIVKEDDYKGFELLFRHYYKVLCSYALRYVATKEAARDVVSEVFYRLWKNRSTIDLKVSCRAYLFTAVRNQAYNYLSRECKKDISLESECECLTIEKNSPEAIFLYRELDRQLNIGIELLTPQCKTVFMMSRCDGLKYNEIADRLNITQKAVEAQISRALKLLRPLVKVVVLLAPALLMHQ